jgi:DNA-3-methyladenine glycosylase II
MYVRESPREASEVPGLLMDNTTRRRSSRVRKSDPIPPPAARPRYRWAAAVRHLRRVDPHLRAIIDRVGPCRLEPKLDRFGTLVRAIIGQQISSKAAASIHGRLVEIGGEPHRPERLIELGEVALRGVGLSGVKARYVLNLAEAVASGAVPLDAMDDSWPDARIIEALVSIKGIGVWTAEMFLIFALNRPDVLPVGDLGVRAGLRARHGLVELPKPSECHALAEAWRPYRSIASWYLWKGADTLPGPVVASR